MADYRIDVGKAELGFAAGHFITYGGGSCERLHGHNYRVRVGIAGRLNEDGLVYDFVSLKRQMADLLTSLDHRMLIQTENRLLRIDADEARVRVRHGEREYVFPRRDVALLPIENTTAELLAEYLAGQLLLRIAGSTNLREIAVEVEESPGQSATFRQVLAG